tara:strand:- start:22482 stop:23456 length:975 start_codon:yes stop_codon:yes gene_type:complete
MTKDLKELIKYTKNIGTDIHFIQAGGGNTSIKKDGKLYIKASGSIFRNFSKKNIAVLNLSNGEQIFPEDFSSNNPSMESSFHSVIKSKFVSHLHCLRTILISSLGMLNYLEKQLLNEELTIDLIDYVTPGDELGKRISLLNLDNRSGIILLQNHGIIIYGDTIQEIYSYQKIVEAVSKKILNDLNIKFGDGLLSEVNSNMDKIKIFRLHNISLDQIKFLSDSYFFPDQIIYLNNKINWNIFKDINSLLNESLDNEIYFLESEEIVFTNYNDEVFEIIWALLFIISGITQSNNIKDIRLLHPNEKNRLLNMPEEIHRKNVSDHRL